MGEMRCIAVEACGLGRVGLPAYQPGSHVCLCYVALPDTLTATAAAAGTAAGHL